MPIFVPTQGQSAVVPLRAPQVSQVQFNPLNTLGAASLVQRGRAMDIQKELQDYQNRKLDLAEKEFVAENQRELIKTMTSQFDNYAATRKASSGDKNTSYGLDSEFYGNVIGEIDNVYNNQLKKGLQIVSTMQKPDDVAQAQSELIGHLSKSMEEVKNNTRYRDYFKNQTAFNNLFTQLSEKRKENDQVNLVEFTKLTEKMKVDNNGVQNVKSWDFLPDRYIYNQDKAMTAVKDVVSEFAQQTPIKKILDSGESFGGVTVPEGFVGKVMGRAAIDLDMVREAAYRKLRNNHDVVSMAQNIGVGTNLDEDAQIKALIDDQLQTYKNQLGETLDDIVLQNKPATTSSDKDNNIFSGNTDAERSLDRLANSIVARGADLPPKDSPDRALFETEVEKLQNYIKNNKDAEILYEQDPETKEIVVRTKKDENTFEEVARFKTEGLIKRVGENGVEFVNLKTGQVFSPANGEQPQQGTTNPNTPSAQESELSVSFSAPIVNDAVEGEINTLGQENFDLPNEAVDQIVLPDKITKNLAYYTNNPLNIKVLANKPHITRIDGPKGEKAAKIYHGVYPTMSAGIQANVDTLTNRWMSPDGKDLPANDTFAQRLIDQGKTYKDATIEDLYRVWAEGANDKNIKTIADELELTPQTKLTEVNPKDLFYAILKVENDDLYKDLVKYRGEIFKSLPTGSEDTTTAPTSAPTEPANRWAKYEDDAR